MEFSSSSTHDDKLAQLADLFSDIPFRQLKEAFEINNSDFDLTLEHCLAAGILEPNEVPSSSISSSLVACHNSASCPLSSWSRGLSFTADERRRYGIPKCL
jgi:hypothetical protein